VNPAMLLTVVWRTTVILALLTVAYYLLPAGSPLANTGAAASTGGAALGLLVVVAVVRQQFVSRHRRPRVVVAVEALLTVLYLTILVFALTYHRIAISTDQFSGLLDKTDGLYFTVTVMSTVGFGDIHATGTAARAVVTGHMLFNLIYIGSALRLLSRRAGEAVPPRADEPTAPDAPPA